MFIFRDGDSGHGISTAIKKLQESSVRMEKMFAKLAEVQEEEGGRSGRSSHIPRALSVSTCTH